MDCDALSFPAPDTHQRCRGQFCLTIFITKRLINLEARCSRETKKLKQGRKTTHEQ